MVEKIFFISALLFDTYQVYMIGTEKGMSQNSRKWIRCPACGNKTRIKVRCDTVLYRFPLFCPKCRQENLINVEQLQITVVKERKSLYNGVK